MSPLSLRPGDVIGTDVVVGPYLIHHVGIVSRVDVWRGVHVISNSKKAGRVTEEFLDDFTGGNAWRHHPEIRGRLSSQEVVRRARERIGMSWHLFQDNCEHFVRDAHGLVRRSPQLVEGTTTTLAVGALGILAVYALSSLLSDD